MRALYLTHHGPWPATSGGRVRDAALVPRLARLCDLEVWGVSRTAAEDGVAVCEWSPRFPVRIFPDEAPRRPYPTRDSADVRQLLRDGSPPVDFDVVHVEGHYLFHLLPPWLTGRTVLVEHNIESHLLRQRAGHGIAPIPSTVDIETVEAAEEHAWTHAGLVLTLSEEDSRRIRGRLPHARVAVCPNGADHIPLRTAAVDPVRIGVAPRIAFLANYRYPPNQDAVRWLVDDVFPRVRRELPAAQLLLAGNGLADGVAVDELPDGVVPVGWVEDIADLWDRTDVVICPLRIGGGMKVKVTDAVRAGLPTVATGVALEGMPPEVVASVVRADDAGSLAEGVVRLCTDPTLRARLQARLPRAQQALPAWSDVAGSIAGHWSRTAVHASVGTTAGGR